VQQGTWTVALGLDCVGADNLFIDRCCDQVLWLARDKNFATAVGGLLGMALKPKARAGTIVVYAVPSSFTFQPQCQFLPSDTQAFDGDSKHKEGTLSTCWPVEL
jgi:hypothetical protein